MSTRDDGDAPTLDGPTLPVTGETISDDAPPPLGRRTAYETTTLLGKGGMGEVVLAHDARIGRNVALKRLRTLTPSKEALARFLREARIQARLEHPAIVPVYDLGHGDDGAPYFTMKRLTGTTLLDKLDTGDVSRQALLRTFIDVCLAIEFAHARGVVHRDLKPSNIMLGDFGEVYVLDWGVARVLGTAAVASDIDDARAEAGLAAGDITTLDSQTQVGAVLGTPGYMPPEQLSGTEVTGAADVYALGSILFEILATESLHPVGPAAIESTLSTPTASPAARRPELDIPPELDAVCVETLAEAPAGRPSARALADRVQRYLDGDRDIERRRTLARDELVLARAAVASGDPARRADAVAAAGRALALDPTSKPAAELVSSLMLAPPDAMPPELAQELAEVDRGLALDATRQARASILMVLVFLPFVLFIDVISWPLIIAMFGGIVLLGGFSHVMYVTRRPRVITFMIVWNIFMLIMGRAFGPWVIVPGLVTVSAVALISLPQLVDRPWLMIGTSVGTLFAPVLLEWAGVFRKTWSLQDGALVSHSGMLNLDGTAALALLAGAHFAMVTVNVVLARDLSKSRRSAHHRAEMQAWHLRKLVPGSERLRPPTRDS